MSPRSGVPVYNTSSVTAYAVPPSPQGEGFLRAATQDHPYERHGGALGSPRGQTPSGCNIFSAPCSKSTELKKTAMPWGPMITCVIAGGSPPHRFSASNIRKRSFTLREACNSRREHTASLINSVGPYEACVPRTSQSFNYNTHPDGNYSSSSSSSKSSSMKTA